MEVCGSMCRLQEPPWETLSAAEVSCCSLCCNSSWILLTSVVFRLVSVFILMYLCCTHCINKVCVHACLVVQVVAGLSYCVHSLLTACEPVAAHRNSMVGMVGAADTLQHAWHSLCGGC